MIKSIKFDKNQYELPLFIGSDYSSPLNQDLDYFELDDDKAADILSDTFNDLKKIVVDTARAAFHSHGLPGILAENGIKFINYEVTTPNYYNYGNDELMITLVIKKDLLFDRIDGILSSYIKNYIDNVRIPTQEGYWSFEPESIQELKDQINNYNPKGSQEPFNTLFFAILEQAGIEFNYIKEGIAENVRENYESFLIENNYI